MPPPFGFLAPSAALTGFLLSDDPAAAALRETALELVRGIYDGIQHSGVVTGAFAAQLLELGADHAQSLHIFLPVVVQAGALYGIVIQPLMDVVDLIQLVFGDLAGMLSLMSHLLSAALASPQVAYALGSVAGQQGASGMAQDLLSRSPAGFYFWLSSSVGSMMFDGVMLATGGGIVVTVGTRTIRATRLLSGLARALTEAAEALPASATGRRQVIEGLRKIIEQFEDRWRLLYDIAEDSPECQAAIERLLDHPNGKPLLDDLAEFFSEAEDEARRLAEEGAPDAKSEGEVELRQDQVLRVLEKLAEMDDVELDGLATYRRIFVEDGVARGLAAPWTYSLGSGQGKKGGNLDTFWYDIVAVTDADGTNALLHVADGHPIGEDFFRLLGELAPVANGRGIYAVLVDFWAGGTKTAGAVGSLYSARKLKIEFPDARFDFEISIASGSGRRQIDVLVHRLEDAPDEVIAADYLLCAEVKNISNITENITSQIVRDLARHIDAGDLDFERLRWMVPQDNFQSLEGRLAAEFRAALAHTDVQNTISAHGLDPADISRRLDAALTNGTLIDSFGLAY
jgi:hypothetical protein